MYEIKLGKTTENVLARLETRRVKWPSPASMTLVKFPMTKGHDRIRMLNWIDQHTSSQFYMAGSHVGFKDERDTLMFKLGWKL